jgi:nucleoid DNA-binding protein
LNTTEFVLRVSEEFGVSKSATKEWVDAIFSTLGDILAHEDSVKIRNFGTFKRRYVPERLHNTMEPGEMVYLPAKYSVKLVLSDLMQDRLSRAGLREDENGYEGEEPAY